MATSAVIMIVLPSRSASSARCAEGLGPTVVQNRNLDDEDDVEAIELGRERIERSGKVRFASIPSLTTQLRAG